MQNPWLYIKSEWKASKILITGLVVLLGLSISSGVSIRLLDKNIRLALNKSSDEFTILIGAQGSAVQLFLTSVYLQAQPLPLLKNVSLSELAGNADIAWYAPLAFGDNYAGSPIVGTSKSFILKGKNTVSLQEGRIFSGKYDAVIGSNVPLDLYQSFVPLHGTIALPEEDSSHANATRYTVVGRLPFQGTPYDNAILVPIESIWENHHLFESERVGEEENLFLLAEELGISALVVSPKNIATAYKIRNVWNNNFSQAVFSGEVLTYLFSLLGNVRDLMQGMAMLSQGIALCAMAFVCVFAVLLRRNTLILLHTLGASPSYLICGMASMILGILLLGTLCGLGLGYIFSIGVNTYLHIFTGIML